MRSHDPTRPLVFIHVPKTAGSSVQKVFRSWYGLGFADHYFNEQAGHRPVRSELFDQHTHAAPICIYGHFNRLRGFGTEANYPDATQFMTILRDPFEMACSHYHFVKNRGHAWKDQTRVPQTDMAEYLAKTPPNMLNHFPRAVTLENYKAVMEEFFIGIGIMADLTASLSRFAQTLGFAFDPAMLQHLNATPRDEANIDIAAIRADFEERYPLEHTVYAYARDMFAATSNGILR